MLKFALVAVATVAAISPAGAVAFQNGSFEVGTNAPTTNFATLGAGSTAITGWVVGGTSIDWIGTYWQAAQGTHSIDLAGTPGPGSISQTFDTIANQTYQVSFALSGNPDGLAPIVKLMTASPGGYQFTYDRGAQNNTAANMKYQTYAFQFTANSASSTISFASDPNASGNSGAVLDNVSVTAVPEPITWGMMVLGFGALGATMRRRQQIDAFSL